MLDTSYYSHPTAVIDDGAKIGSNSKIWHFSHVMNQVIIGSDCVLGQNVFVMNGVTLGNNVKVQNNVSLYDGVICEDNVFIGPSAVFTNVINPRSNINRKTEFQSTRIRVGATVGANATIVCGNEIGKFALIGAGSVVTKSIKAYALVMGNPAKQVGWVSERGLKLQFDKSNHAICPEGNDLYILENEQVRKG